jgi:hypothetical protein
MREATCDAKEKLLRAYLCASLHGSWLPRPAGENEGCRRAGCHCCFTGRTPRGRRGKSAEGGLRLHTLHAAAPTRGRASPCSAARSRPAARRGPPSRRPWTSSALRPGPPPGRAVDLLCLRVAPPGNEQTTPRHRPSRGRRFSASCRFFAKSPGKEVTRSSRWGRGGCSRYLPLL